MHVPSYVWLCVPDELCKDVNLCRAVVAVVKALALDAVLKVRRARRDVVVEHHLLKVAVTV